MNHRINTIIDRFANCSQPKILHRVVLEVPVDIVSDRELDRYTASSAIHAAYPGAVVKQIRRLANG